MKATPEEVFDALTNPELIEKWSGASAEMDANNGSNWKLWNGDIYGKNTEVIANEKLVQDWYSGSWKKPSKVEFILRGGQSGTTLDLIHEDIPDEEYESIKQGWIEYYLGPMKEMFEEK